MPRQQAGCLSDTASREAKCELLGDTLFDARGSGSQRKVFLHITADDDGEIEGHQVLDVARPQHPVVRGDASFDSLPVTLGLRSPNCSLSTASVKDTALFDWWDRDIVKRTLSCSSHPPPISRPGGLLVLAAPVAVRVASVSSPTIPRGQLKP